MPIFVCYLEIDKETKAHGTGTQVGDKVEIEAISKTFRPSAERPLLVGSVKTNLGHGEGVSGINSIIKVAMSLENAAIAPTLGVERLRSELSLKERHIEVVTTNRAWPSSAIARASVCVPDICYATTHSFR